MGLFDRGVRKTKEGFFQRLSRAVVGKSKVDDEVLDAIEEALANGATAEDLFKMACEGGGVDNISIILASIN